MISDDDDFADACEAIVYIERKIARSFMTLPEDPLYKRLLQIKIEIRDYLNNDQRLVASS